MFNSKKRSKNVIIVEFWSILQYLYILIYSCETVHPRKHYSKKPVGMLWYLTYHTFIYICIHYIYTYYVSSSTRLQYFFETLNKQRYVFTKKFWYHFSWNEQIERSTHYCQIIFEKRTSNLIDVHNLAVFESHIQCLHNKYKEMMKLPVLVP